LEQARKGGAFFFNMGKVVILNIFNLPVEQGKGADGFINRSFKKRLLLPLPYGVSFLFHFFIAAA
jgi:hypothetical protein